MKTLFITALFISLSASAFCNIQCYDIGYGRTCQSICDDSTNRNNAINGQIASGNIYNQGQSAYNNAYNNEIIRQQNALRMQQMRLQTLDQKNDQ